jgi:GNAT superfamily N-acetyltransferase
MGGEVHPREALSARVIYVAVEDDAIVGFIAGHLTRRFDCQGELQWIDVVRERRRNGIASELLRLLREWFVQQKALRVCVDPGNAIARQFYARHGAVALNRHWMVWEDLGIA